AFEANRGQAGPGVGFVAHAGDYTLNLSATGADLTTAGGSLGLQLVGANPAAKAVAVDPLVTRVNYLSGNDPGQWLTNIPTAGEVDYQNVYPGIGVDYHGNQGHLEYDFTVAPGADPKAIRLAVTAAKGLSLDAQGDLVIHTAAGDLQEAAPVLYQTGNGVRQAVAGRFVVEAEGRVGFQVGKYDHTKPLVIDPVLSYSTLLPANVFAEAVDAAGDAYVGGGGDFVGELNPTGTALLYATYLGGGNISNVVGIAVDAAGDAFVTGYGTVPTTANAFSPTG